MTLNTRLRLKHYATPKPYTFQVGPYVYEYDPLAGRTSVIERKPLAPPNVFDYNDPDGMLHIRPAGDLKRTQTHK